MVGNGGVATLERHAWPARSLAAARLDARRHVTHTGSHDGHAAHDLSRARHADRTIRAGAQP